MRQICVLADEANKYLEETQPWQTVKTDPEAARAQLSAALEASRLLAVYLKPIIPSFVANVERCLAVAPLSWASLAETPGPRQLGEFERLADRIDPKAVEAMIAETVADQAAHK